MSIEQHVKEVIAEVLDTDAKTLPMNTPLIESLNMDSTEVVDLRVSLEKKFNTLFVKGTFANTQTPSDIAEIIRKRIA